MPPKGWIRAVRDALGMNGRQLADRLNVTRQRASLIEKDELGGSATLKTMRRSAGERIPCVRSHGTYRTMRRKIIRLDSTSRILSNNLPMQKVYFHKLSRNYRQIVSVFWLL